MNRLVIDTNLYIDWLNEGLHEDVLFRRDAVEYLSGSVVYGFAAATGRSSPKTVSNGCFTIARNS